MHSVGCARKVGARLTERPVAVTEERCLRGVDLPPLWCVIARRRHLRIRDIVPLARSGVPKPTVRLEEVRARSSERRMILERPDIEHETYGLVRRGLTCVVSHSYGALFNASAPRQNAPLWDHTLPNRSGCTNATYAAPRPPALDPVTMTCAGRPRRASPSGPRASSCCQEVRHAVGVREVCIRTAPSELSMSTATNAGHASRPAASRVPAAKASFAVLVAVERDNERIRGNAPRVIARRRVNPQAARPAVCRIEHHVRFQLPGRSDSRRRLCHCHGCRKASDGQRHFGQERAYQGHASAIGSLKSGGLTCDGGMGLVLALASAHRSIIRPV